MKKILRLTFPRGEITQAKVYPDGTLEILLESAREIEVEDPFVVEVGNLEVESNLKPDFLVCIEASKLRLTDDFMQYKVKRREEKKLKGLLEETIKKGVRDFYRPMLDPSISWDDGICFKVNGEPAVGKSYLWWKLKAKMFWHERNSRLGTKSEYIAFLGVLIKKLVEEGMEVSKAWKAVCSDSIELGHYWNSSDTHTMLQTGTREICGFCDLANTRKILADDGDEGIFWKAGGCYDCNSISFTLADFEYHFEFSDPHKNAVGWIVFD